MIGKRSRRSRISFFLITKPLKVFVELGQFQSVRFGYFYLYAFKNYRDTYVLKFNCLSIPENRN